MGKLLKQQRRGKGSNAYRAPSHRYKAKISFRGMDEIEKSGKLRGEVMEFVDDPGHQTILMHIKFTNGDELHLPAPEGIAIGDEIFSGADAPVERGCVLPLENIPEGMYICNIEFFPGDGGKMVRAPGAYGVLVSKEEGKIYVKLPSKKVVELQGNCRAELGVLSGGGRLEMPLLKAGANHYKKHAQNRLWPKVRGVKMNAYTHPYGGKQHHKGTSSCTSRGAPPGRKVGHIAAKSTGRKKTRTV
ncbi:MAG: 50S ribosomal protein L2 [Candidatus Micrarchaeota archaeon]